MDLKLLDADPTESERACNRRGDRHPGGERPPHGARESHKPAPPPPRTPCGAATRRLRERRRARLRVTPARRPAGGRVRRRDFYALLALEPRRAGCALTCAPISRAASRGDRPSRRASVAVSRIVRARACVIPTIAGEEPREEHCRLTAPPYRRQASRVYGCCAASPPGSIRSRSTTTSRTAATRRSSAHEQSGLRRS